MDKVAILAITKNGIKIATRIKQLFPSWEVFVPSKFQDNTISATWYEEQTSAKIAELFGKFDGLVCIFSLGAVIRLVAPFLKDKKTDPAVIVIDDKVSFVISALSGHLGGANELTEEIAKKFGAVPVVTTAADVNKTIPVDLVGKEFGWKIDNDSPRHSLIFSFVVSTCKPIPTTRVCGLYVTDFFTTLSSIILSEIIK